MSERSPDDALEAEQEFTGLSDRQKTILSVGLDWVRRRIVYTFSVASSEGTSTVPTGKVILAQPRLRNPGKLSPRAPVSKIQFDASIRPVARPRIRNRSIRVTLTGQDAGFREVPQHAGGIETHRPCSAPKAPASALAGFAPHNGTANRARRCAPTRRPGS